MLFIAFNFTELIYLLQIIKFLQLVILLFIARRFLKIYFKLDKKNSSTRFYNHFFCILVMVNMFLMVTLGVFMVLEIFFEGQTFADNVGNSYIVLSHAVFSFFSSLTLFLIGLHLKRMIKDSLKDSYDQGDMNHYIESKRNSYKRHRTFGTSDSNKEKISEKILSQEDSRIIQNNDDLFFKQQDEYYSKRVTQINLITITFLICDVSQLVYTCTKMFFIPDHFENDVLTITPLTKTAAVFFFCNNFTFILPIFTNYLAFYFLIRQSYKPIGNLRIESINSKDLLSFSGRFSSNQDIEKYLCNN